MYFRLIIVWATTALLAAPVMGGSAIEETVVDSNSGEVTAIIAKKNGSELLEVNEPAKLCLDNQTVQEVRDDGTVICYDTATGSFTSYLNIELKSTQSVTSLKAHKSLENTSPCPEGSALLKVASDGSIECESL